MLKYEFLDEEIYFILFQDGEVFIEDYESEYWELQEIVENEMLVEENYEDIEDK